VIKQFIGLKMKQILIKKLLFLLLIFSNVNIIAQKKIKCVEPKTDTAFLMSIANEERNVLHRAQATSRMLKVFVHILCDASGTNPAITEQQLDDEFTSLIADYASNSMCFFLAGYDTIQSTRLNNLFNVDTDDPNEFDPYQVPNCLNIFYVRRIDGTNSSCSGSCGIGGIALGGIPGTFCLVDDGNVGEHTIAHELGHCLGLSHTFARINGRECINGSNSFSAGDLIIDTPADPYSFNAASCYSQSTSSCATTYIGNCTDPCGDNTYDPPYLNLMSYWNSCSAQSFSDGQFVRVNSTVDNYSPISVCTSPANITQNAVSISSGYFIKAAINSLTTNGAVNMTGATVASFGASSVSLTDGFSAKPSGLGSTTIKATQCD
jgi:hypothetical protein